MTTQVDRVHPFQVLLLAGRTGLRRASMAQAEQIRSVAVQRIGTVVGRVPLDLLADVDDAIGLHLSL